MLKKGLEVSTKWNLILCAAVMLSGCKVVQKTEIQYLSGNEGGFNPDMDGEFGKYDPQNRPVLHPWAQFSGIDTKHYISYGLYLRAGQLHNEIRGISGNRIRGQKRRTNPSHPKNGPYLEHQIAKIQVQHSPIITCFRVFQAIRRVFIG